MNWNMKVKGEPYASRDTPCGKHTSYIIEEQVSNFTYD